MTMDTFEALKADVKNIVGLSDAELEILSRNGEQLLHLLDTVIRDHREELMDGLKVENPDTMLSLIAEFLRIILTGAQDFESIRKLALRALKTGTSIYKFALTISTVLDRIKPLIMDNLENPEGVIEALKKFSVVMLILLADEINQAFLQAVREATGMSQALLENYMKSVIDSLIESEGA